MTDVAAEDSVQGDEQQPARDPVDQQLERVWERVRSLG